MLPAAGGGETLLVLGSGCPELVLTVTFPTQQSTAACRTQAPGTGHRDYTLVGLSPCQYYHQHWLFTSYLSTIRDHGLTEKIMHDYLTTISRLLLLLNSNTVNITIINNCITGCGTQ